MTGNGMCWVLFFIDYNNCHSSVFVPPCFDLSAASLDGGVHGSQSPHSAGVQARIVSLYGQAEMVAPTAAGMRHGTY